MRELVDLAAGALEGAAARDELPRALPGAEAGGAGLALRLGDQAPDVAVERVRVGVVEGGPLS